MKLTPKIILPLVILFFSLSSCRLFNNLSARENKTNPVEKSPIPTRTVPLARVQSTSTVVQSPNEVKPKNDERQKLIDEVINLLKKDTKDSYSQAYEMLRVIGARGEKYGRDEEILALRSFALDMAFIKEGRNYSDAFGSISPKYDGIYCEQIRKTVLSFISESEWEAKHKDHLEILGTLESEWAKPLPAIGMTADEVLNSRWGEPRKINRTTTADTVHEQWVYGDGKYLYLENGIVTAIQE